MDLPVYALFELLLPRSGKENIRDLCVSRGEFLGDAKWMGGNRNTVVMNLASTGAFRGRSEFL